MLAPPALWKFSPGRARSEKRKTCFIFGALELILKAALKPLCMARLLAGPACKSISPPSHSSTMGT